MIQNDSQLSDAEIKRYLYGEMAGEEQAAIEARFFENDELFFEIADAENRLVDLYVRGGLTGEELKRFERSLGKLPERRAKVANAVALQTFFEEEKRSRPIADAVVEQTFRQRLADIFAFKTPAFGYAMGGLLFIFTLASILLLLENRRQSNELARLQNAPINQREFELENELENARTRENELRTLIDAEREASGDLTDELESEKQRRERIQSELDRIKKERDRTPAVPTPKNEPAPVVASILLTPLIITRGEIGGLSAKNTSVERGTKRVAVRLALPDAVKPEERFSVRLNDQTAARDLAARTSRGGQKTIQLTVSPNDLIDGANKLSVIGADGREVSRYLFNTTKK